MHWIKTLNILKNVLLWYISYQVFWILIQISGYKFCESYIYIVACIAYPVTILLIHFIYCIFSGTFPRIFCILHIDDDDNLFFDFVNFLKHDGYNCYRLSCWGESIRHPLSELKDRII